MEQVLGEHVEPEPFDLGACQTFLIYFPHVTYRAYTSFDLQNRAYAASQLVDLSEKLAKAAGSVTSTRAPIPALPKDEKSNSTSKVGFEH